MTITARVLLVSARAGTASQAEATANAVAESYIGYVSSASSPPGPAISCSVEAPASGSSIISLLIRRSDGIPRD